VFLSSIATVVGPTPPPSWRWNAPWTPPRICGPRTAVQCISAFPHQSVSLGISRLEPDPPDLPFDRCRFGRAGGCSERLKQLRQARVVLVGHGRYLEAQDREDECWRGAGHRWLAEHGHRKRVSDASGSARSLWPARAAIAAPESRRSACRPRTAKCDPAARLWARRCERSSCRRRVHVRRRSRRRRAESRRRACRP
jgi:hypothetical protein